MIVQNKRKENHAKTKNQTKRKPTIIIITLG